MQKTPISTHRFGLKVTEQQWQAVCAMAREQGRGVSEVLRQGIDRMAADTRPQTWRRPPSPECVGC